MTVELLGPEATPVVTAVQQISLQSLTYGQIDAEFMVSRVAAVALREVTRRLREAGRPVPWERWQP